MTAISRKSIVAIRPDGSLAGYFKRASDLVKVLDVDWGLLRKALEEGEVYNGLKWMFEPDFRDKWMVGESMKFNKPEDYERYASQSKEDNDKKRRVAELECALKKVNRMKSMKRSVPERKTPRQRVVLEVVFPDIGIKFDSVRQACRCMCVPVSTMYRYASSGKRMERLGSHVVIVYEE